MEAVERRRAIAQRLAQADGPVSAAALAKEFSVSRQIIVGDVALLRARGWISLPPPGATSCPESRGAGAHGGLRPPGGEMARELEIMVDHGCQVLDVVVEHPVYGQLTGQLRLSSRYDVQQFMERSVSEHQAQPLSDLTGGVHLHTLRCPGPGPTSGWWPPCGQRDFC